MRDYTVADTFFMAFTTRAFATGVPTVLAGTPVVSAYEDAGLTQITAGITLGVSHDSVVGLNMLTIVATGANGYEAGKDYHMVITTGTVGGVSVVGEMVGHFSLSRSAAAVDLANGTDGLGAIKADTAATLIDTGTTLPAQITVAQDDLDIITGAAGALLDTTATSPQLVDDVWDEVLTGGTHNITNSGGKRLRDLQEAGTYSNGTVYVDTVDGTAGTAVFDNGTEVKPSLTFADALTIAADAAVNAKQFQVTGDSSITLAATINDRYMSGHGWALALGGQDITELHVDGASVSGTGTGSGADFHNCTMGTVTLDPCSVRNSYMTGNFTIGAAGVYHIHNCHDGNGGAGTIFDLGAAIGNTTMRVHNWDGNIDIRNLGQTGTDVIDLTGEGVLTINANCIGGTINYQGAWELVDNSGGAVTLNPDDSISGIAAILTDTDATIPALITALNDFDPATDTVANVTAVASVAALSAAERNAIADALLTRDWTAVSGEAARSVLNALRFLRNKWAITGASNPRTLTVYEEDDSTTAWDSSINTAAGDPVSDSDPT